MIVTSLSHARKVIKRICSKKHFSIDTETKPAPGYEQDKKAALVINRSQVEVFSICHRGESYSFLTNIVDPRYPLMAEYAEILQPYIEDPRIVKVMHNANYDINVFWSSLKIKKWKKIWDTMLGCWIGYAAREKGLKSRAPLYGRFLQSLKMSKQMQKQGFKAANAKGIQNYSLYAEEDVILTDEIYQMQRYGFIERPAYIEYLSESGNIIKVKNNFPPGKVVVPDENLDTFERAWLELHEMPFLRSTIRAEQRGFPVNRQKIIEKRKSLEEDTKIVLKRIYRTAGEKINLGAPKQLQGLFKRLKVPMPYKNKKGNITLNKDALFLMKDSHPIVQDIVNYRKLSKLDSTYLGKRGLEFYISKFGKIHTTINTVGAVTGRTSSDNPNLQNIPARADTYGIRECFEPPKGKLLICLDYAQLEIRVMALLCKDPNMLKILTDPDGDIHQNTADEFGVDRSPTAKNLNFLMLYGGQEYMLAAKLTSEGVPTTPAQAKQYIITYDQVYSRVHEFRDELLDQHQQHGYVKLLTGRKRMLPDIDWNNSWARHKAETTLSNNVIQGSGQDLLKASIMRSDYKGIMPDYEIQQRLVLKREHRLILNDYIAKLKKIRRDLALAKCQYIIQVHDEVIYFADKSAAEDCGNQLAEIMTWRHFFPATTNYDIPLVAEGGIDENWKAAKSKTPMFSLHAGL